MFVRVKTVKGNKYFYLIENKRVEGKPHPVQQVIEYLGNQETAIATLEASSYPDKERLLERVRESASVGQAPQKHDKQENAHQEGLQEAAPLPQSDTNNGPKSAQKGKQEGARPDPWGELNERQRQYLEAIYRADQEAERWEASSWKRGQQRRPADVWRWLPYDLTNLGSPTPLKRRLLREDLVDPGTGSTFSALARRGLVLYEEGDGFMARIRLTTLGRKVARMGLGETSPRKLPTGTLREWHWQALAALYADWLVQGEGFPETNKVAGWNTWLRLLEYKPEPLALDRRYKYTYHLHISDFGRKYYEENYQRYRELYPDVDAPAPTHY